MSHALKIEFAVIGVLLLTAATAVLGSIFGQDFLINHEFAWRAYFWTATLLVFAIFMKYPSKKPNLIGDVMVAFILGWMWWPFAIWYAMRSHSSDKERTSPE